MPPVAVPLVFSPVRFVLADEGSGGAGAGTGRTVSNSSERLAWRLSICLVSSWAVVGSDVTIKSMSC